MNEATNAPAKPVSVVITGSECTGKSTLSADLAADYGVEFVPEYVRQFVSTVGGRPQFSDHGRTGSRADARDAQSGGVYR